VHACARGQGRYALVVSATDLLALYDRHERREARPPGLTVEVTPRVVRHIGPPGHPCWVLYADLDGTDPDGVIRGEQAHFGGLGRGFEWKHFAHDRPADLPARLLAAGFVAEPPEALMALDLTSLPAWLDAPAGHGVREGGAELQGAVGSVMAAVWPGQASRIAEQLAILLREAPDAMRLFVAFEGHDPVAAAWSLRTAGSPFLGLFGGSSLPEHRGRGHYRALVAARARHALAHGARALTVDAGPMSAPILERLGFERLTITTPFVWQPAASS
jgi:GNAT superfamily N-acetyltransferase